MDINLIQFNLKYLFSISYAEMPLIKCLFFILKTAKYKDASVLLFRDL